MNRPWHIWGGFGACMVVVLIAMGWITHLALRLERSERDIRRQAELEERVRLALWRMESALAPLIAEESGRPYFAYTSFYAPDRAYTRMFSAIEPGEVLVPSPLLTANIPNVLLHFQIEPDGTIHSPQVPEGNMRDLAEAGYTSAARIEASRKRLVELGAMLIAPDFAEKLPSPSLQARSVDESTRDRAIPDVIRWLPPAGDTNDNRDVQTRRSANEMQMRQQQQFSNYDNGLAQFAEGISNVSIGAVKPLWRGDNLMLARRVLAGGDEYVQGCCLDWPGIRQRLVDEAQDLLPNLDLEPADPSATAADARLLAALPVRLEPGSLPVQFQQGVSAIRYSLAIAWACVIVAAGAVAILLRGTVSLSERRAAFVSAVTHEMRTPLTTFRMYTDMLLKDMVPTEEKRRKYLATLQTEALRLGHLVENVLAYARLEKSRDKLPVNTLTLEALVNRVADRLAARATQANMEFTVEPDESMDRRSVRADAGAVEQILFNLVDNACKYATNDSDRRIHMRIQHEDGRAAIEIGDHGPGVSKEDARRLFQPFRKSAHDAANSSPGVGLGLALSRRLAREMGGDLRLNESEKNGAHFVLTLPTCPECGSNTTDMKTAPSDAGSAE